MPMNETPAFDAIAAEYDKSFSESLIGGEQRERSRHWLRKILETGKALEILEINCGTGEDALWMASLGHSVVATDQSAAMINEAEKKLSASKQKGIKFISCGFENLASQFDKLQFDFIFSNFSGLNCVSPDELTILSEQLNSLLKVNGCFAVTVFGKHSWWEVFFFLLKAQPAKAFRRWGNKKISVELSESVYQPVYYYSVRRLKQLLYPLRLVEKKPVGLFIPPTYLEASMKKRPNLFRSLIRLEKTANGFAIGSSFADHVFLLFKKQHS